MKESIQQKIDQIMQMAKNGPKPLPRKAPEGPRPQNGLSSVIRNQREADIFMAELKAIIHLANTQQQ